VDAWELFLAAASKQEIEIEKVKREVFEVDWQLIRLLIDTRDLPDRAEAVEQVLQLLKDLNAR